MRLLLNILQLVFGGWIAGSLWLLAGVILAITIVGLPWTPAAFRMASCSYWPFVGSPSTLAFRLRSVFT